MFLQESVLSVAVFEHAKLLYAEHLDMVTSDEAEDILLNEDIEDDAGLGLDENIDLEDISVDQSDIDSLDDLGDIEDLDAIEDIDEFSENKM